jgi:hypothetical protein
MKSAVYVSSEKIEAIGFSGSSGGKIALHDYVAGELPEGVVMNGKIIDNAAFNECLIGLKKRKAALFKRVSLTIDGSSVLTKKVVTPKLNKWQYLQLALDELSETTDNPESLVCNTLMLRGQNAMLAVAAEKAQIDSYANAFKAADIMLESINIGVETILSYVNTHQKFAQSTCVINLIDGVTMLSMVFSKGVNVFISRTRLFGEENNELLQNVLDNLSGIIQFAQSEKFENIENSYYLGLKKADVDFMASINPYSEIVISELDVFQKTAGIVRIANALINEIPNVPGKIKLPEEAHFVFMSALQGDKSA